MGDFIFRIGNVLYGSRKVLIVAEIGTGHGGDEAKADELIAAAVESGADCVKFTFLIVQARVTQP